MPLQPKIKWVTLTADGVTTIGTKKGGIGTALVLASGNFGGGTLTGGYLDDTGTFQPSVGGVTAAVGLELPAGTGVEVAVQLSGSTSPSLKLGLVADGMDLA